MVVDVLNDEHYANLIRNGGLPQSAATVGILSETNQKFEIHGLLSTFEELGESPLTDWLDIPGNS
jgi:hypothetical protein